MALTGREGMGKECVEFMMKLLLAGGIRNKREQREWGVCLKS